jgi:hypothetical protein
MMRDIAATIFLAAVLSGIPWIATAHEVRPGLLQMTETAPDQFDMLWRVPARGDQTLGLTPVLPATCETKGLPERRQDGVRAEEQRKVICPGGLARQQVRIDGLERLRTDVLVRVDYLSGGTETLRATPEATSVELQGQRSLMQVAVTYFWLGVEHILLGIDHLLFVTALLLLVSGWKRLLGTVTAFTLAHSITLAAATLGFVSAPSGLIEALIAMSIMVVAAEVVLRSRGETGIAIERPWLIAFGFGLLHGFGFAGALSSVGLPPEAVPAALLFFNVGVEAGQILFILALLLASRALDLIGAVPPRPARAAVAYGIGTMAAFWAIERTLAIWA